MDAREESGTDSSHPGIIVIKNSRQNRKCSSGRILFISHCNGCYLILFDVNMTEVILMLHCLSLSWLCSPNNGATNEDDHFSNGGPLKESKVRNIESLSQNSRLCIWIPAQKAQSCQLHNTVDREGVLQSCVCYSVFNG